MSHSPAFEVVPGAGDSPVVLHVPHASTRIPDDVRRGILLDDEALALELHRITDADTDAVALAAADRAAVRPWIFRNDLSRLVVDPERFPDEREEMNDVGMGVVYERTTHGETLRTPTDGQRDDLVDRFFTPYAAALTRLVEERLEAAGEVTILDVHSFPREALPYERHGDGPRPEVCIGTDPFHTSDRLRTAAVEAMRPVTPTGDVGLDSPFSGCYVPLAHHGVHPAVGAVMLELRRDVVADRADALAAGAADLLDAIAPR